MGARARWSGNCGIGIQLSVHVGIGNEHMGFWLEVRTLYLSLITMLAEKAQGISNPGFIVLIAQ